MISSKYYSAESPRRVLDNECFAQFYLKHISGSCFLYAEA